MSKFCTGCGQPLAAESAFCEECGKPVAPSAAVIAPAALQLPAGFSRSKLIKGGAIAAVSLLLSGGGLYFLLRETPLPSDSAMAGLINGNASLTQRVACTDNFDYAKSPVSIGNYDGNTRRLMDFLVQAGLYTGPERVTQSRGFFYEEVLRYTHTDAIKPALKGKQLCFANGITVDRVSYDEIDRSSTLPQVSARVFFKLADQAAWSSSEEARQIFPQQLDNDEQRHLNLQLHLKDGNWQLGPAPGKQRTALQQRTQPQMETPSASGLLDNLLVLFSGNPAQEIIGKWSMQDMVLLEFSASSVSINGESTGASYRREGKTIIVSTDDQETLRVEPLSGNSLRIKGIGGQALTFSRVE